MVNTISGVTAQALLHRYFPAVYLVLTAILGCIAGWLATIILGGWLAAPVEQVMSGRTTAHAAAEKRQLSEYQVILDRNIFNAAGPAGGTLSDNDVAARSPSSASSGKIQPSARDLALIGTIAAGPDSLVVLRQGKETFVYRLGDEIADGVTVKEISRNTVILAYRDGSRQTLTIVDEQTPPAAAPVSSIKGADLATGSGITQVDENRWVIPREVADQARENVNELLKQARMEPRIVDGETDGFVVRMVQPRSLLDKLGLRRGDVVMAINGVGLDSPEKALQIFQQLREARNIKVNLLRRDQPITLEYEAN